jgi:hypothetical protein
VRVRMRTITVNFVPALCCMIRVVVVFLRCCVYYAHNKADFGPHHA